MVSMTCFGLNVVATHEKRQFHLRFILSRLDEARTSRLTLEKSLSMSSLKMGLKPEMVNSALTDEEIAEILSRR